MTEEEESLKGDRTLLISDEMPSQPPKTAGKISKVLELGKAVAGQISDQNALGKIVFGVTILSFVLGFLFFGIGSLNSIRTAAKLEEISSLVQKTAREQLGGQPTLTRIISNDVNSYVEIAERKEVRLFELALSSDEKERRDALQKLNKIAVDEEQAVAEAEKLSARAAKTRRAIGAVAYATDTAMSLSSYKAAIRLEPNDPDTLIMLSKLYTRIGEYHQARETIDLFLADWGETHPFARATGLTQSASIAMLSDDLARARIELLEAIQNLNSVEYGSLQTNTINNLYAEIRLKQAHVALWEDEYEEAGRFIDLSQETCGLSDTCHYVYACIIFLSRVSAEDVPGAREVLEECTSVYAGKHAETFNLESKATYELARGLWEALEGNREVGLEWIHKSLATFDRIGLKRGSMNALQLLSRLEANRMSIGDFMKSPPDLGQAAKFLEKGKDLAVSGVDRAWILQDLGKLALRNNDLSTARSNFAESLTLFDTYQVPKGQAEGHRWLGQLAIIEGDVDTACDHWLSSVTLLNEIGDLEPQRRLNTWIHEDCS